MASCSSFSGFSSGSVRRVCAFDTDSSSSSNGSGKISSDDGGAAFVCLFDYAWPGGGAISENTKSSADGVGSLIKTFFQFSKEFDSGDVVEAAFGRSDISERVAAESSLLGAGDHHGNGAHRRNLSKVSSLSSSVSLDGKPSASASLRMFCQKFTGGVAAIFVEGASVQDKERARHVARSAGIFFARARKAGKLSGMTKKAVVEELVAAASSSSSSPASSAHAVEVELHQR